MQDQRSSSAIALPLVLCAALALAPGAARPARAPERLALAPPAGAVLRHEHRVQHLLTTSAMHYRSEGGERISQRGFDVGTRLELLTSDRVLAPGDRRHDRLQRRFDRARLSVDVHVLQPGVTKPQQVKFDTAGGIEGKSVVFTWIEEEQDYGRYYDEEEGVEEDLPRLLVDLDLAGFLPPAEVQPGATWSVDPGELRHVVGPGGFLAFDFSDAGDVHLARALRGGLGTHMHEPFAGDVGGEVRATYRGRRDVEGRELAVIEVAFDATAAADLTFLANRSRTPAELELGIEIETSRVELDLAGKGEILWEPALGHLVSASFAGDETVRALLRMRVASRGEELLEQELELAGTFRSEASVRLDRDPPAEAGEAPTDRK